MKDPQPPSFTVHLPRLPEVPDPYSWVVGSQVFWSFSTSLGGWWDISTLVLCVSGHAPLNCPSPNLALLHIPRIPGLWESQGILVQFSPWAPQRFSYLWELGWTSFFLCFVRSKACLFMGLGPFLWILNGFGPSLFLLKAQMFFGFQSFVLFWALIHHCDILDLNNDLLE